jgi:hypothetical protein
MIALGVIRSAPTPYGRLIIIMATPFPLLFFFWLNNGQVCNNGISEAPGSLGYKDRLGGTTKSHSHRLELGGDSGRAPSSGRAGAVARRG